MEPYQTIVRAAIRIRLSGVLLICVAACLLFQDFLSWAFLDNPIAVRIQSALLEGSPGSTIRTTLLVAALWHSFFAVLGLNLFAIAPWLAFRITRDGRNSSDA
jgi:hypothetical protein